MASEARGTTSEAGARPLWPPDRQQAWSLGIAAAGWVCVVAVAAWGGGSPAVRAPLVALMVPLAFWHGWTLGWAGGLAASAVCGAADALTAPQWGGVGTLGVVGGLVAAALAGGVVRQRRLQAAEDLGAVRADAVALAARLREAREEVAALHKELREAQRLAEVGTTAAQIAHQLRNPLTSMQLYVQLLEDELRAAAAAGCSQALQVLELVCNELKVLVEITDNYLQYARLPELEAGPTDLNRTVAELVRFLSPELSRKGLVATTRLADRLPAVAADRRLLRFALMNLLKNAAEAMGPGGRLRVTTAQANGAVEVHVSDTGPGVAPADIEHIFEPFYTTKEGGSGLGLALSRQIAEKHGGALACESMVGVGTTFVVRLPLGQEKRRTTHDGNNRGGHPGRG